MFIRYSEQFFSLTIFRMIERDEGSIKHQYKTLTIELKFVEQVEVQM